MEKTHAHPITHYVLVWLGLLGLTGLSFGLSLLHLGAADIVVALAIAIVKSTLVLLFFMHLIEQRGANAAVVGTLVFFVVLLTSLMAADVATRERYTPDAARHRTTQAHRTDPAI
jgi:cytochrome c oxidase subunit 4